MLNIYKRNRNTYCSHNASSFIRSDTGGERKRNSLTVFVLRVSVWCGNPIGVRVWVTIGDGVGSTASGKECVEYDQEGIYIGTVVGSTTSYLSVIDLHTYYMYYLDASIFHCQVCQCVSQVTTKQQLQGFHFVH